MDETLHAGDWLVRDGDAESIVFTGASMAGVARTLQVQAPVPLLDEIRKGFWNDLEVEDLRHCQLHLVDHATSPVSINAAITGL